MRGSETVVEATYPSKIEPWWELQPDCQYVMVPGGGIPEPDKPGHRIGDAAVFVLRSVVTF